MAPIAVTILDPTDNRSAHLVETGMLVRDAIPPIVAELGLPTHYIYELALIGGGERLPADQTLAASGVVAGMELQLRRVGIAATALAEPTAPLESTPSLEPTRSMALPASKLLSARANAGTGENREARFGANGSIYQLFEAAANGSGLSLGVLVLLFVGVLAAGGILLFVSVAFLPSMLSTMAERVGIQVPNGETLGTGDVQVTLRWEGEADLDLRVVDPNGEEVSYENPASGSGGILDADANGECEGDARPVENIYWPTGDALDGTYRVRVVYYQSCGYSEPVDYEVTITLDGEVFDVVRDQATSEGEADDVTIFYY